jgi:hypothetical protein
LAGRRVVGPHYLGHNLHGSSGSFDAQDKPFKEGKRLVTIDICPLHADVSRFSLDRPVGSQQGDRPLDLHSRLQPSFFPFHLVSLSYEVIPSTGVQIAIAFHLLEVLASEALAIFLPKTHYHRSDRLRIIHGAKTGD